MPWVASANDATDTVTQLNAANTQAAETSQHISNIDSQLDTLQAQIASTQAQISATNAGIADAKARMAKSQITLGALVQSEYQGSKQTKLEMLVGSNSLSDYVDKEQYLKSGQDKIAAAVEAVVKAKKELDAKLINLNKLNVQLADAQNGLTFAKAQAQNQLAQLDSARNALKVKLAKYQNGRVVNVGDQVHAGDLIGFEGTSGCSTGPHLHFEVDQNGSPVNPLNFTPGRLRWPLDPGYGVAQDFGKPNWSAPYSFHTGMDLTQYFGAPVYAAADGTVSFSGYDHTGFGDHVIISHGGGLQTLYGHLGARASDYPNCAG